ncbi:MAG: 30S ribosomal protein S3 [Candidatus Woesearchaeota archaeon]|jgi:small subunit ribosomal protein S3
MGYKKIVEQKIKEFQIQEFIRVNLKQVGLSSSKLLMTPLGEKIVVNAARPGLIVGKRGQSIKKLTGQLKKKFNLENPQIEINEITDPNLDAGIIAERISMSLERFGSARFKAIGHKVLEDVMNAGALGIEVVISGKVPSTRAKRWRFYQGYLKKSGEIAISGVRTAYGAAQLKSGIIGIQVRIMPPIDLPDRIKVRSPEDVASLPEKIEEKKEEKKPKKRKKKEETGKEKKEEAPAEKTE